MSGVAQAQQYINLPGTQPGGLNEGAPLDSSSSCGVTCHYSRDIAEPSAMPYDTWAGSMMANAMRDPLFLAALTVAEQDAPGVGDYCLRCHTPPGFVGGRTRSTPTASRGTALESADLDGVTCDSCHRMTATTNRRDIVVLAPRADGSNRFATGDDVWCTWNADDVYQFSDRQAEIVLTEASLVPTDEEMA